MKRFVFCLILSLVATSLFASDEQDRERRDKFLYSDIDIEGVVNTWNDADVFVPGNIFTKTPSNVNTDKIYPVVIYMHGCSGITQHDYFWARYISTLGFIVVQPKSFARPNRKMMCNPANQTVDKELLPRAFVYRQQEIRYALAQVKQSSWADKDKIFLMGHSEGAVAAALTPISEFKGIIISSWTCTHPVLGGIHSDKNVPVLAMSWTSDRWYYGRGLRTEGHCVDEAEGRANFTQVDLQGSNHFTFQEPIAREAVKTFLTKED